MMFASQIVTITLLAAGAVFFMAGTVGLLRFPDTHSRLHAVTKADNLGLGCIIIGLMLQADSISSALKLFVIWVIVLAASSTSCYLIAQYAARATQLRR